MFSKILNEERLSNIIKIFDRDFKKGSIESDVKTEIDTIMKELTSQSNEFTDELVRDRTLLKRKKTQGLRNRAQDGHIQLVGFKQWLLDDIKERLGSTQLNYFIKELLAIINYFEDYVLKLKDRETTITSVWVSFAGLIIATVAIVLSVVSIVCR